jgi:hypothetical protein
MIPFKLPKYIVCYYLNTVATTVTLMVSHRPPNVCFPKQAPDFLFFSDFS